MGASPIIPIVTAPIFLLASPGSGSAWLAKLIEVTNWRLTHNPFALDISEMDWHASSTGNFPSRHPAKHSDTLFDYASLVFRGRSPAEKTISRRRFPCADRDLIVSNNGHGLYSWLLHHLNFKTLFMVRHPLGAVMVMEKNKTGEELKPFDLLNEGEYTESLISDYEVKAIRDLIDRRRFPEAALAQWFIQTTVYTRQALSLPAYNAEIGVVQYEDLCANPIEELKRAMNSIESKMDLTPSVLKLIETISDRPAKSKFHSKPSSIGSSYAWKSNPNYKRGSDLYSKCHQLARAFGYDEWLVNIERTQNTSCLLHPHQIHP